MSISTVFLTLALMITTFCSIESVQAMDISSFKNQALTSIRLELWYQGVEGENQAVTEPDQDHIELPEELTVALQKQLAH